MKQHYSRPLVRRSRRASIERLDERRLLAADWQNPVDSLDVDASGVISPSDVLVVVNRLNASNDGPLPELAEGVAPPPYVDTNGDGRCSPLDALLVVNAINKPRPALAVAAHLAPESDPNGNGVVLGSEVIVMGQTAPGARVTIRAIAEEETVTTEPAGEAVAVTAQGVADATGRFALPLEVNAGKTRIEVTAAGRFGGTVAVERFVRRGDVVLDWNASLLNVIRDWTSLSNDPYDNRIVTERPPMAARNLAMVHAAMYDAVNGIEPTHAPYHVQLTAPAGASKVAAAAAAAERVASQLYRDADERAVFAATLSEALSTVPDGLAKSQGIEYGQQVGDAILVLRAADGADATVTYTPGTAAGQWRRTFPDFLPPLLPQWPAVQPLGVADIKAFRPAPPPSLESAEYAAAVDEAMRLGGLQSSIRTAEQTEIAIFWSDGGGTFTPPGHWNQIAVDVALREGSTLEENARLLALLNIALADAGIASWDAKYAYELWRPIDAIRMAETDGNAATTPNPEWLPLLKNPPFPTYTSGHSTFSGAADAVLSGVFGPSVAFTSEADGHSGFTQRPLAATDIVTRSFSSFSAAAEEAGLSRIYGGIHFSFDNTAGLEAGRAIGTSVISELLTPRTSS